MGHKPNISQLRIFDSKDWAIIPIDKRKDFQSQSRKCIMLGYAQDVREYKLMKLETKMCFIECSVQFEQDQLHDPK